jgi:GntR family transcriptional repressor for pyruvate dehydrogenase complex
MSPSLPRIARPASLSEEVFLALEERIRAAEFRPGDRLPTEKQLSALFGVSRAVVREAVARLRADGYVETRQGAGAYVCGQPGKASFRLPAAVPDGPGDGAQIFELRLLVEAGAAELGAQRRTAADLRRLRTELKAMAAALKAGTDGAAADDAFHRAIAAATHNPYVGRLVEFLGRQFSGTRRPTWAEADRAAAAQQEHEGIFAAIAAGDAAAARAASEAHLRNTAQRLGIGVGMPGRRRTGRKE